MVIRRRVRKIAATVVVAVCLAAAVFAARHWLAARPSPALLLREAIDAIEAKDRDKAIRLLDTILQRDPANAKALLYRGEMARDAGDVAAALGFWARIGDDRPQERGTARLLEGLLALSRHEARDAERLFLESIRLHPTFLRPREKLAGLYQLQLRSAELGRELAAIHERRPWSLNELVASLGTMGRIYPMRSRTRELEELVAADEHDVLSALALAECRLADDDDDQAARLLERTLASNPDSASVRGRLAELRVKMHDAAAAERLLDDGIPGGENTVEVQRAQGALRVVLEDWPAAAEAFRIAVALDADHQPTLYRFGLALERLGRREEARKILSEARLKERIILQSWRIASIDSKRGDLLAPVVLEIARLLMELERYAHAALWFEQALAWRPDDASAREMFALAIRRAQESQPASTSIDAKVPPALRPSGSPADVSPATRSAALPSSLAGSDADALPPLTLIDRHAEAGLDFQYFNGASGSKFLLETLGGGVAAIDYDGDGWPDLYFTQGRPLPVSPESPGDWRDRLFRNFDGTFRDVTEAAGLGDTQFSQGCSAGDFDNDGFPDLAVANFGTNVLCHNNGDGTFSDVTLAAGLAGEKWHSSLAFADLDRDGNLDLYVVTYVRDPYRVCHPTPDRIATCSPLNFEAEQDQLYHSRGDGTFEDVSAQAGILAPEGKGLGIIVADLDNDGWPDVYIANDGTPNFLFQNQTGSPGSPLRFEERGLLSGSAVSGAGNSQAGMGIACADLDGGGLLDLYVTNFFNESGTFYRNQGGLLFVDATSAAGLLEPTRTFLGFGTQPIDIDLDGRPDLFIANGHIDDFSFRGEPWKMRPQVFHNRGSARFAEASSRCGPYFQGEYLGRGVARLDWDRDGRSDLVVVHQDRPAALLANETPDTGSRAILELHGVASNRDAIGARIALTVGGVTRIHEISGGDGFFASNERRVILGVGHVAGAGDVPEVAPRLIETLEIRWPSGRVDRWQGLPLDVRIVLIESREPTIGAGDYTRRGRK